MKPILDKDALERFETIWNHVECGIAIVDAKTREIIDINPVATRMFGGHKEKILGHKCHKFICPADEYACPVMDKGMSVDRSERVFVCSNGATLPIIKSVAKIHYNGKLALLESFTDISNLKEAEQRVLTLQVAEHANKAKSDFLSRMSHEMRTPLTAILGMVKISENTEDIEKLKHCLSTISVSATHMLGLINDVLDMSKIEAGKLELDFAPINLEAMLSKNILLVSEKAEEKEITLHVSLDKSLAENYIGDELRLSQVVTNILSNAVKFTPQNGIVRLTADEIHREGNQSVLRFTISDTGIGLTEEQFQRLFKPFEQADTSISRHFGGTGLGLAISKNIVETMNGRIWAESAPGKGSTFCFEVKLERPEIDNQENDEDLSSLRVLVVDDNDEDSLQLASIADRVKIHTDIIKSGTEAQLKFQTDSKLPYDVVFVSSSLTDADSIEIVHLLKSREKPPAIILTGSFSWWSWHASKEIKNIHFLTKPFFPTAVLNSIKEGVGLLRHKITNPPIKTDNTPDLSHIEILFAEDIEINREIFSTLLENTGIRIVTAINGKEAVDLFAKNPNRFNLIITDVQMPVMDGYEATRKIREMPEGKNIPIIAMTANVFREDIEKCLDSGMNDHLKKPINVDEVIEKIIRYST